MDFLIIALILVYAFLGFYKGALKMLVSLFSAVLLFLLSYYVSIALANSLQGSTIYQSVYDFLQNIFDNMLPGEFESMSEVLAVVGSMSNVILRLVFQTVLKNITFEGSLSFGEIITPTFTIIFFKVILFIFCFILLSIAFKIISFLLKKSIESVGLGKINRVAGFLLGGLKGFVVSMVVFIFLSFLSSLGINSGLTSFVEDGVISSYLYNQYFLKIFELFY